MKKHSIILIVILACLSLACHPVRWETKRGKPIMIKTDDEKSNLKKSEDEKSSGNSSEQQKEQIDDAHNNSNSIKKKQEEPKLENSNFNKTKVSTTNFQDTTYINLSPIKASKSLSFASNTGFDPSMMFEETLKEFDKGNMIASCDKFKFFSETLDPKDTLYAESQFYYAECLIQKNNLGDALRILRKLENDNDISESTEEKVIVRIGQINCLLEKFDVAEKYFDKLKSAFPNSIYTKLANCKAVR